MSDRLVEHRGSAWRRVALRVAVLATFLATATFIASAQPASAACPDGGYPGIAGQRVKSPTNDAVYMIDPAGYKRRIRDAITYNELFRDWSGIITTAQTPCYLTGPEIEVAFDFLARTSAGRYYFIESIGDRQFARWIPSVAVYNKYHFSWSTADLVSQEWVNAHPGDTWT